MGMDEVGLSVPLVDGGWWMNGSLWPGLCRPPRRGAHTLGSRCTAYTVYWSEVLCVRRHERRLAGPIDFKCERSGCLVWSYAGNTAAGRASISLLGDPRLRWQSGVCSTLGPSVGKTAFLHGPGLACTPDMELYSYWPLPGSALQPTDTWSLRRCPV